jgi:Flp pilus assembly protein TadG
MIPQSNNRQRGNVMVESALVLLVFFLVVFSILDFGQVLLLHDCLTERVRSALRYGVVNSYDGTAIQNYVLYGQPVAPSSGSTYFSLTASMVSVQRSDAGTADDRVTITVSNYPYVFLSPFIAGQKTGAPIVESLPYEGP